MTKYLLLLSLGAAFLWGCHNDAGDNPPAEVLAAPTIIRFYSLEDTVGAVVTVIGKNFSQRQQNNTVSFNGAAAVAFYARADTLKVRVPAGATTGPLQVQVYAQSATSPDPFTLLTGHWRRRADCPGPGRFDGIGLAIGSKCYIGTGTGKTYYRDFWEYDPSVNRWTQKADFAGGLRREAISFVLNGKGYVGFGTNTATFDLALDFWEYDPATDRWTRKANIPSYSTRNAVGLAVNGRGYVVSGDYSNQVFEYNPTTDAWVTKKNFPGQGRAQAVGLVLGNKAYVGGGNAGSGPYLRDFWEYDPALDQWTQKADLLAGCVEGVGTALNGKGYVGVGYSSAIKQLDEYDPARNAWARKAKYPGEGRQGGVAFAANGHVYVANGLSLANTESAQIWEFTP